MRDQSRITRVLSLVRDLWQTRFPDMRFFQFISCLSVLFEVNGRDAFYVEDEELIERIMKLMGEEGNNG